METLEDKELREAKEKIDQDFRSFVDTAVAQKMMAIYADIQKEIKQAKLKGAQIMYDAIIESQMADNVKMARRYSPVDVIERAGL